jgi:hypothetical protein
MYLQVVKMTVLHCIPPPPGKPLSTTLCAFFLHSCGCAEGPRLEFHVFFVHDGEGFLLLALLFVDCRFSANLLRKKNKKQKVLCRTNPSAENGLETQMKLPELLCRSLSSLADSLSKLANSLLDCYEQRLV